MNIFQRLFLIITPRGREIRRFAKDYDLNIPDAFKVVRLFGSVGEARKEIERLIEEQKKLRGYSGDRPTPPQNTYTSGSRLSSSR